MGSPTQPQHPTTLYSHVGSISLFMSQNQNKITMDAHLCGLYFTKISINITRGKKISSYRKLIDN